MPAQPQDDKFSIDYSLGQVAGHVALDTVSLGQPPTRVTQQAMGLATSSTADFSTTSCDGVFVSLPRQVLWQHLRPSDGVQADIASSLRLAMLSCYAKCNSYVLSGASMLPLCHQLYRRLP